MFDLGSFKSARKTQPNATMKSQHLAFTEQHEIWTVEDRNKVMFSDEATVFFIHKINIIEPSGKRFD